MLLTELYSKQRFQGFKAKVSVLCNHLLTVTRWHLSPPKCHGLVMSKVTHDPSTCIAGSSSEGSRHLQPLLIFGLRKAGTHLLGEAERRGLALRLRLLQTGKEPATGMGPFASSNLCQLSQQAWKSVPYYHFLNYADVSLSFCSPFQV